MLQACLQDGPEIQLIAVVHVVVIILAEFEFDFQGEGDAFRD